VESRDGGSGRDDSRDDSRDGMPGDMHSRAARAAAVEAVEQRPSTGTRHALVAATYRARELAWSAARASRAAMRAVGRHVMAVGRLLPHGMAPRRIGQSLFVALAVLSLLLGMMGSLAVLNVVDALAAERDAMAHVRAIQSVLADKEYTNVAHLQVVQSHLQMVADDLRRLQGNGLLGVPLADRAGAASVRHALAMASDLVAAGQEGLRVALLLLPHVGTVFQGVNSTGPSAPILSSDEIGTVSSSLANADHLFHRALGERDDVRDDDLRRLGLSSLVSQVHQFDALVPKLSEYLSYARTLVAELPTLLGLATPAHYLVLDLDSDELRPGGGFIGNYAVVTLSGGRMQDGLHLHDIYTLDCPRGCPYNRIPDAFAWMDLAPTEFGLRDANLSPDYPQSARLLESLFAREGGGPVDGVICVTPALIQNIMRVTGPISVPEFNQTVGADNLQDILHYYHLQVGADRVSGGAYGTTSRKVLDALLGANLLHTVATLAPAQQQQVGRILLDALLTRDLQVYLNDAQAEQVLIARGVAGQVYTPVGGDSLLVVDANIGVGYANADIAEQIADAVMLDAQGTATHELTIKYTYAKRTHLYDAAYTAAGGGWYYRDFVQVILPEGARITSGSGCRWVPVTQAGHVAHGCLFVLGASRTLTLNLHWVVPNVVQAVQRSNRYELFVQRQAGNAQSVEVTLTPSHGAQLLYPIAAPLTAGDGSQVKFAGSLTTNQDLVLGYTR